MQAPASISTEAFRAAEHAVRVADLDPAQGLDVAADASAFARRARDAAAAALAERAWGHSLLHCGQMDDAIRHLRQAVRYGEAAGSPGLAAEAKVKLSHALMQRGRPAQAVAAADAAIRALNGSARARARAQRAIALHVLGRPEAALADFRIALSTLRRCNDVLGVQRMLINRSFVYAGLHNFAPALADLAEAERLAQQLGRKLTVGIIAENLAAIETLRGDVPAALAHLERAESIITAQGAQLGDVYKHRAELLVSAGLLSEGRAAAQEAITTFRRERRFVNLAELRLLLAQAAFVQGDLITAAKDARRARREFASQHRDEWAALATLTMLRAQLAGGASARSTRDQLTHLINTLADAGWPGPLLEARLLAARLTERRDDQTASREHLDAAIRIAHPRAPADVRARGFYARALGRSVTGDIDGALRAARSGLRVLDEHAAVLGATDVRVHAARHRAELTELGLRLALHHKGRRQAFEWAERGKASQLLRRALLPPDDPELAALLADLRSVVARVDTSRAGGRAARALAARQRDLERRIRDICRVRPGAVTVPPAPVTPGQLAESLDDRVLLEYMNLDGTMYRLTLLEGRLGLCPIGATDQIADLVERLQFAVRLTVRSSSTHAQAVVRLLGDAAGRLDAALFGAHNVIGDRPVVIVPTSPLHRVAWAALPSCRGRPVAVTPSATLWQSIMARPRRSGGVLVAAGPGLPGARDEALAVAQIYGTTALVDDAATVAAVLPALGAAQIAHVSAHGRLSAENPLFSSLQLTDGPMVVYDIERVGAVPELVVLAACDLARDRVEVGDELLGLSAAFLTHGAANLIVSLVPLPDLDSAPAMVALHRHLKAGVAPAHALAAVQSASEPADTRSLAATLGLVCLGSGTSGSPA